MDGTPDWTFLRGREKNENNSWIFTDQRQHWFIWRPFGQWKRSSHDLFWVCEESLQILKNKQKQELKSIPESSPLFQMRRWGGIPSCRCRMDLSWQLPPIVLKWPLRHAFKRTSAWETTRVVATIIVIRDVWRNCVHSNRGMLTGSWLVLLWPKTFL